MIVASYFHDEVIQSWLAAVMVATHGNTTMVTATSPPRSLPPLPSRFIMPNRRFFSETRRGVMANLLFHLLQGCEEESALGGVVDEFVWSSWTIHDNEEVRSPPLLCRTNLSVFLSCDFVFVCLDCLYVVVCMLACLSVLSVCVRVSVSTSKYVFVMICRSLCFSVRLSVRVYACVCACLCVGLSLGCLSVIVCLCRYLSLSLSRSLRGFGLVLLALAEKNTTFQGSWLPFFPLSSRVVVNEIMLYFVFGLCVFCSSVFLLDVCLFIYFFLCCVCGRFRD